MGAGFLQGVRLTWQQIYTIFHEELIKLQIAAPRRVACSSISGSTIYEANR